MKCRVTIELQTEVGGSPLFANITDVSLGGCYVETSTILAPGSKIKLGFSMDDPSLCRQRVWWPDSILVQVSPSSSAR